MSGDDEAQFTHLYAQLHSRVLAFAWRRVSPDLAREVTDETFLIAWRRRAELPRDVLPWLLGTARNLIAEQLRKGQRQDALALELSRCAHSMTDIGADELVLERMTVLAALKQLTEQDRDALILTEWDGLSHRQAAAVSGCSTATFAVRVHRARRRLAAALEQPDGARPSYTDGPLGEDRDACDVDYRLTEQDAFDSDGRDTRPTGRR